MCTCSTIFSHRSPPAPHLHFPPLENKPEEMVYHPTTSLFPSPQPLPLPIFYDGRIQSKHVCGAHWLGTWLCNPNTCMVPTVVDIHGACVSSNVSFAFQCRSRGNWLTSFVRFPAVPIAAIVGQQRNLCCCALPAFFAITFWYSCCPCFGMLLFHSDNRLTNDFEWLWFDFSKLYDIPICTRQFWAETNIFPNKNLSTLTIYTQDLPTSSLLYLGWRNKIFVMLDQSYDPRSFHVWPMHERAFSIHILWWNMSLHDACNRSWCATLFRW